MSEEKKQEVKYEEDEGGESVDLTEKIKKVKEKLKQCQKEKQEYLGGWQRCQADFINYRRRQEEQMGEWSKMFGEGLIRDILPVLDALESGIKNSAFASSSRNASDERSKASADKQESREKDDDLEAVRKQLWKILQHHGLQEIKLVGEKFNPEFHEAVEQVESEKKEGMIIEEVQKGYLMNGKVIRTAKVKVTKN